MDKICEYCNKKIKGKRGDSAVKYHPECYHKVCCERREEKTRENEHREQASRKKYVIMSNGIEYRNNVMTKGILSTGKW